MAHKDELKDK